MSAATVEYNPKAISDVECACGCQTLMTMGWLHGPRGSTRRFLNGHKPSTSVSTASGTRKYVKSNMGPEQIVAYFDAQVEQLKKAGSALKTEAQDLLARAKIKMNQVNEIDQQITQLSTVKSQTQEALSRVFKTAGAR